MATRRIIEKSMWKHLRRFYIDRVCALMEAFHQKKMFEPCVTDIQSQAAFDLAVKGLIRLADPNIIPMIYTIKCIDFKPLEFTLVAEVGYGLKSSAYFNYIQCTQFVLFNVKYALLSKHWDLRSILDNIDISLEILEEHPYMLKQEHAHLVAQAAE